MLYNLILRNKHFTLLVGGSWVFVLLGLNLKAFHMYLTLGRNRIAPQRPKVVDSRGAMRSILTETNKIGTSKFCLEANCCYLVSEYYRAPSEGVRESKQVADDHSHTLFYVLRFIEDRRPPYREIFNIAALWEKQECCNQLLLF